MHQDRKLFLGRALDKLGRFDESVKAYQEAAEIKPNEDQAWQGLRSLFESRGSEHVDTYINVGRQLAEIYMQAYVEVIGKDDNPVICCC